MWIREIKKSIARIIIFIFVIQTIMLAFSGLQSNIWITEGSLRVYANQAGPQRIPVLMYHALRYNDEMSEEQRDNPYVVSVEDFYRQMRYLYDNNFHTITPDELKDFLFYGAELPARSIFIQFDDGFACNIIRGYPILKQFGMRATIFSITSHAITHQEPFNPETLTTFITKEEMDSVRDVFTFASHSHNLHAWMRNYTKFIVASRAEIIDDLRRSFEIVDNTTIFAFPGGFYNQYSIAAIQEAGIRMAFTGEVGYVTRDCDPLRLQRFGVYNFTPFSYFREYVHVGTRDFTVYAPSVRDLNTIPDIPSVWYLRNPSEDFRSYVNRANRLGLTTDVLVGQYRRYITRAEFATLAVRLFEKFVECGCFYDLCEDDPCAGEALKVQFSDTDNIYVEKLAGLGIVSGIYESRFEPDRWITIPESVTMLEKLSEVIDMLMPKDLLVHFDNGQRYSNRLTRQESAKVFVRLYDSFAEQRLASQDSIANRLNTISVEQKIMFLIPVFMLLIFALIKRAKGWVAIFGLLAVIFAGVLTRTLAHDYELNELSVSNFAGHIWLGVIVGAVLVLLFAGLGGIFKKAAGGK